MNERTESQIYNDVLESMLSYIAERGLDTSESGVAYSLLAPAALGITELYLRLDEYENETFADTASLDNLKRIAAERGIEYRDAECAVLRMTLDSGEFTLAEDMADRRFALGDRTFYVSDTAGYNSYRLCAENAGLIGSAQLGSLVYLGSLEGISGARAVEVVYAGRDGESAEQLRKRFYESLNSAAFAGNKAAYKNLAESIAGVGGCRVDRIYENGVNVLLTLISETGGSASSSVYLNVVDAIDEVLPICHNYTVRTVIEKPVSVSASVVLADGYTRQTAAAAAEQAISDKLRQIALRWTDGETVIMRKSDIFTAMILTDGIEDIRSLRVDADGETDIVSHAFSESNVPFGVTVSLSEAAE